jgi:hypothetical protein
MSNPQARRVIAYVDGFNLYFGLRSRGWRRYYWLNLQEMVHRLLLPAQDLVLVRYFTARIRGPRPSQNPDQARQLRAKH